MIFSKNNDGFMEKMFSLVLRILYANLCALGLYKKNCVTISSLKLSKNPFKFYESWLQETTQYLIDHKFLDENFQRIKTPENLQILWEKWNKEKINWKNKAGNLSQLELIEICLKALSTILRAECLATDIIFPNSSLQLVEGIYKGNEVSDYFNHVLTEALIQKVQELLGKTPTDKIRILEVGAGTGGTTASILPRLAQFGDAIAEYCYTDISKAFLIHAESTYRASVPYLATAIFDVSQPLLPQKISGNRYDFVIAANVLHATKNIRETLSNTKALLRSRGVLLLNELSDKSLFTHLTFGLLEGWWFSEDKALRIKGSPGLYPETWMRVLEEEGFLNIHFPRQSSHAAGQQVIVATSDGYARQKQVAEKPNSSSFIMPSMTKSTLKFSEINDTLRNKSISYLKDLVAETLKMNAIDINAHAALEEYGLDSILVIKLTNQLNRVFPSVRSTLFFEYKTIANLTDYLLTQYEEQWTVLFPEKSASDDSKKMSALNDEVIPSLTSYTRARFVEEKETHLIANSDIAIIGVSGCYPMAKDIAALWENLKSGKDCVIEVPSERWDYRHYYDPDRNTSTGTYSKWGSFVEDFDHFDPLFFNISPKEAERMDPQERLFLEIAWKTIEDAGYSSETLTTSLGVFVGVMYSQAQEMMLSDQSSLTMTSSLSSIANRVSYYLNSHGPSMAIDTMCSSSLTSIHLACASIRLGECKIALAGGVNVSSNPNKYVMLSQGQFLSSDGKCRSFGEGGDGLVPGEGVGAVLLKSLSQAQQDGDHIYGVIKGSSVNHGGKTNGYTVPNPVAQSVVIQQTLEKAKIDPRTISYIEAHGTGTSLGDPIELRGLSKAFEEKTQDKQFCSIGSIKSNLGHCESAAGIVGVTKVLLQMQHKQLVPSLHSETINPNLDLENSPFYLQHTLSDWHQPEVEENGRKKIYPRRAGISSFGAGGSNAHIIIEEAPEQALTTINKPYFVITLSGKTAEALRQRQVDLLNWLSNTNHHDIPLNVISYTLNQGRSHFNHRAAWVINTKESLKTELVLAIENKDSDAYFTDVIEKNKKPKDDAIYHQVFETLIEKLKSTLTEKQYKEALEAFANLHVKGYAVDWKLLHQEGEPRQRVSLPTYPFEKKRYWVSNTKSLPTSISTITELDEKKISTLGFYQPEWQLSSLEKANTNTVHISSLLIFSHDGESIELLKQALYKQQPNVLLINIELSEHYQVHHKEHYTIKSGKKSDYEQLFQDLNQTYPSMQWQYIVDLLPYAKTISMTDSTYSTQHLLILTQVLLALKISTVRLLHIYANTESQLNFNEMNHGFAKSLEAEHPGYFYQIIGVDSLSFTIKFLAAVIAQEFTQAMDIQIRYQDSQRYVSRIIPITLEEAPENLMSSIALRHHGVYLITGGLGGLGLIFAKYLSQHYQAKLILTGRSVLDETRQVLLNEIKALGGEVTYMAGDISDYQVIKNIIQQGQAHFGKLNGIIHAAGVLRDGFIVKKADEEIQAVFAPKINGLLHLDQLTQYNKSLDYFMVFSSTASVLGNIGQSDYASANAFMDTFIRYRDSLQKAKKRYGKSYSINWPLWSEGGMQMDVSAQTLLRTVFGMDLLPTEVGLFAFERVLKSGATQVIPLFGDQEQFYAQLLSEKNNTSRSMLSNFTEEEKANLLIVVKEKIKETMVNILKVEFAQLNDQEELACYGFDSISLTDLSNSLNKTYKITLTPALFYQYSTIEKLSHYLLESFSGALCLSHPKFFPEKIKGQVLNLEKNSIRKDAVLAPPSLSNHRLVSDVAIVGMAGIFPGASNVNDFWVNLCEGVDSITAIPKLRTELTPAARIINWGGFVEDVDKFDASFFNISPREAELMDPQQRLLLQVVYKTIEDAGYAVSDFSGKRCGLFAGVQSQEYASLIGSSDAYMGTGNSHSILANRISYLLNLTGPSEAIDTACASSLVAIHRAVQSIQTGESECAIAGGVNCFFSPEVFVSCFEAGMLSQDGRCKTFDEKANGYVRSEGVGTILLKPLTKAQADGDHIYGIIKGSAVNHGGHVNTLTAPNPTAQAAVIEMACKKANITPDTLSYIEVHGTGTSLGDPIEINGLKKAFKDLAEENHQTLKSQYCGIGSVKTNIGHLETAAGIAGVIKTLLAMQHQTLPKSLHCENINPYIELENSPFYLVTEQKAWTPLKDTNNRDIPRRAGVSSFGFGGSNAHIILEEAPEQSFAIIHKSYFVITLSGKTAEALKQRQSDLLTWLNEQSHNNIPLNIISYTLNQGRNHFTYRAAWVVDNKESLKAELESAIANKKSKQCFTGMVDKHNQPEDDAIYTQVLKNSLAELKQAIKNNKAYREILSALANLYVKGYSIDWELLHQGEPKQRVSLPTYPFAKERYWVPESTKVQVNQKEKTTLGFYEPTLQALHLTEVTMPVKIDILKLRQQVFSQLSLCVSEVLKLPVEFVNECKDFSSYGFDSISLMEFANAINKTYGIHLTPSIFFEHSTLELFIDYLLKFNKKKLVKEYKIFTSMENTQNPPLITQDPRIAQLPSKVTLDFFDKEKRVDIVEIAKQYNKNMLSQYQLMINYINVEGYTVEVLMAGVGEPLVFLVPLNCTAIVWINQIRFFAKTHQIIVIHPPGYGKSDWVHEIDTIEDLGKWMMKVISTMEINYPFHLVGLSFGSLVAQCMVENHKKKIKNLVLISTLLAFWPDEKSVEKVKELIQEFKINFNKWPVVLKRIDKVKKNKTSFMLAFKNEKIKIKYSQMIAKFNYGNITKRIKKLPTLLLVGEKDNMTTPKYVYKLHKKLHNSSYKEIVGTGHMLPPFSAKEINTLMKKFFQDEVI